jgi:hypothetical protein
MISADSYVKSGAHLPAPLRDFHDAKDVFRTMHERMDVRSNECAREVTWVRGQCYVIDLFLWFMAKRGWTLQRSRAKVEFLDLAADIKAVKDANTAHLQALLAERKTQA